MPEEIDIVKLLVKLIISKDKEEIAHCINNEYDATLIPALLQKNGVAPLAYENLKKRGVLYETPTLFSSQLENYYKQSIFRNFQLRAVYDSIGKSFMQHDIPFVALKGIYLQHELYSNPCLRPMLDIDIFIPGQFLSVAKDAFLKMGGTEIFNDPSVYINSLRHQSFPILYKGISVELHRNIIDSFDNVVSIDQQLIMKETVPFAMGAVKGLALSDELLLIHLCHHVFSTLQGGTVKLIFYFDIHFFIEKRGNEINWNKIMEFCEKTGALHSVSRTLCIVSYLFGTSGIRQDFIVKDYNFDDYLKLLSNAVTNPKVSTSNQYYISKFSKIDGWKYKFKYLTNRLLPDKRFIIHKYRTNTLHGIFIGYIIEIVEFLVAGAKAFFSYFYLGKSSNKMRNN